MSFLGLFGNDDKETAASVGAERPTYQPSPYHDSASEEINNFYTPRIRGENTGYAQADLDSMNAGAIDASNYATNEAVRRGANARRTPGGVTTGGQGSLRESAVMAGLQNRSAALRDIAVQNSVLKHNDQWNAAQGMQAFLNQQDANALGVYNSQQAGYNSDNQIAVLQNLYGRQEQQQQQTDWTKLIGEGLNAYSASQGSKPTVA